MITRRGFMAATGLVATKLLLPEQARQPQIDLMRFCDDRAWQGRYDMSMPFEQQGITYATDARICVRTTLVSGDGDKTKAPPAKDLPWRGDLDWKPWPKINRVPCAGPFETLDCPICDGKAYLDAVECDHCGGYGEIEGVEHCWEIPCRQCKGLCYTGHKRCEYCDDGNVDYRLALDKNLIAPRYDARIRELADVEYAETDINEVIHFRFTGGLGLLMPLKR